MLHIPVALDVIDVEGDITTLAIVQTADISDEVIAVLDFITRESAGDIATGLFLWSGQ